MGLFGPSLSDKIRRSASDAHPEAQWTIDTDWSTGSRTHVLHGSMNAAHTDEEAMDAARGVWAAVVKDFRLAPDDARDGLLDVRMTAPGGMEQRTGTDG